MGAAYAAVWCWDKSFDFAQDERKGGVNYYQEQTLPLPAPYRFALSEVEG